MTKGIPVYDLVPMEYRVALDAASMWLAPYPPMKLLCEQPALAPEVAQRLSVGTTLPWSSWLWLEPQCINWEKVIEEISQQLRSGGRLAILLSLPSAHKLPERTSWSGDAFGDLPGGLQRFLDSLTKSGFKVDSVNGLHSGQSVLLNIAATYTRKINRFAIADRLEFAARKQYLQTLPNLLSATCAIILASRE